jgi:hypothetical protein
MARKPDHSFNIKSVIAGSNGQKVYLPVGKIALWLDKSTKTISGTVQLFANPNVEYRVYQDDGTAYKPTTEEPMPVDDAPF